MYKSLVMLTARVKEGDEFSRDIDLVILFNSSP